jgi:hypothetical protein
MNNSFDFHENPLIRKLESIFTLSDGERQALLSLPAQATALKENQDIVREGDSPSRSCVIVSGFACSYKVTGQGKRQIQGFYIAGDIPDLQSLHLRVLDNSVGTITPCRVWFIPHEALRDICDRYPRIGLHPMRVGTGFAGGHVGPRWEQRLLAVLGRLSDDNDVAPGQWFVEAGFGRLDGKGHLTFADLEAAQDWISRLARSGPRGTE